ncbi:hypothetical protein FOL47_007938 [Perkinsus chesapeaki]|uniref:Integrase catalytic domain-containing protein n=1 Tax=Perkinsus chesapeaki TaxID=330153 RepID=A0A7J6MWQ1_PERCH|nr:hypothetical protein FOL47_007938 [Perkinsus chesapeaki]
MATPTHPNPIEGSAAGVQERPSVLIRRPSFIESAALFDSPESLREELKKARIHRGKIRSKLRDVVERLNNIIIVSEDDERVCDTLAEQEADLRAVLEEAGAYVIALELRHDQLTELNSQALGRSNASRVSSSNSGIIRQYVTPPAPSSATQQVLNQGRIDSVHSTLSRRSGELQARSAVSQQDRYSLPAQQVFHQQAVYQQAALQQSVPQQVFHRPAVPHQAPIQQGVPLPGSLQPVALPIDPSGSPVIAVGASAMSYHQSSQASRALMLSASPDHQRDVYPGDSASNVEAPRVNVQNLPKKCESADVGKIATQSLGKSHEFAQHALRIEEVLYEAGGGFYDENGNFQPHFGLKHACVQKFLNTLEKCPDVLDTAKRTYNTNGNDWTAIKQACMAVHARRSVLVEKLTSIVSGLKFKSARDIDSYLKEVVAACEIYRVVYSAGSTDAQLIQFVRQILSKLPRDMVQGVIRRCKQKASSDSDWESAVPLHCTGPFVQDTIVEYIRSEARLMEETNSIIPQRSPPINDSVGAIHGVPGTDKQNQSSDQGGKSRSAFREFCGRYAAAFGVTGYGCRNKQEMISMCKPDGVLSRHNRYGRTYYIVGYHNREGGLSSVSSLPSGKFRVWEIEDLVKKDDESGNHKSDPMVKSGEKSDKAIVALDAIGCSVNGTGGSTLVAMANGQRVAIQHQIDCKIAVYGFESRTLVSEFVDCELRILPSPGVVPNDELLVLAGRQLIEEWGLESRGATYMHVGGECVYRQSDSPEEFGGLGSVAQVVELDIDVLNNIGDYKDEGFISTTHGCVDSSSTVPSKPDRVLRADLQPHESGIVDEILSQVVHEGWKVIPKTNGAYKSRVRELAPCETTDVVEQTHVCEIWVPTPKTVQEKGRSYAASLYSRLSDPLKSEYRRLVQEYVLSRWWIPTSSTECSVKGVGESAAAAQVFLIPPTTSRKSRLVVDFRCVNKALPPASSDVPLLFHPIALLRAESRECTFLLDARAAFYKCRCVNNVLHLRSGTGELFASCRLCFGVVFGPCGLSGSLGRLVCSARSIDFHRIQQLCALLLQQLWTLMLMLFVDDMAISGTIRVVVFMFKLLLCLLLRAGFDVQMRKVFIMVTEDKQHQLLSLLSECGVEIAVASEGSFLGMRVRYESSLIVLTCQREKRLAVVVSFIERCRTTAQVSKIDVFKAGGCLSYDPGKQHPYARGCGDAIRSLIARCFHREPWDTQIDLSRLTDNAYAAFRCMLDWMEELVRETCRHTSEVRPIEASPIVLRCYCDASSSGGGIVAFADATRLFSEVYRFKKSEVNWHSNRRELVVLLRMTQMIVDFLEYRQSVTGVSSTTSVEGRIKVEIYCDNLSCVRWATSCDSADLLKESRGVERRVLSRLMSLFITSRVPATTRQTYFQESLRRDWLRLDYRYISVCVTKPLVDQLVEDYIRFAETDRSDETTSLSNRVAKQSFSFDAICHSFKALRFVIHLLKWNVKGGGEANGLEYPHMFSDDDRKVVVANAQADDVRCQEIRAGKGPACGPLLCDADGLVVFRSGSPYGTQVLRYVIPRAADSVRRKILLDGHRACRHAGVRDSLSRCTMFHMDGCGRQMKDLVAQCHVCKILRARRDWTQLPSVGHSDETFLARMPTYYKVAIDFYSVGDKWKVMSACCLYSKHISLFRVSSETAREALRVLRLLKLRTGSVAIVVCDRASYFRTEENFVSKVSSEINARVELISSRAPWELGSEKLHGIASDRLRVMLRHTAGRWPENADAQDELLEEVMLLLNTRPLGSFYVSEEGADIITPDSLHCGRTRSRGCVEAVQESANGHESLCPNRVRAVRNCFMQWLWRDLKDRSLTAVAQKCRSTACDGKVRGTFRPGDCVLVYMGGRKLGMSFRMGHIIECISGRRVKVRLANGLVTTENLYNIVMLYPYPCDGSAVVSREGMYIDVKMDSTSAWRSARVTYDPCDYSNKLWVWFLDGNDNTPVMIRLDAVQWKIPSDACGGPQGGRDETPSLMIGQRISVAYIMLNGVNRRHWFPGTIIRSRSPNIVTVAFDNGYLDDIDLKIVEYKIICS